MKTNELRIGNYYNYDGDSIKLDGSTLASYLQNDMDFYLEPIPLTEEWLLKFGYKKTSMKTHYQAKFHRIWICNGLLLCDRNSVILSNVHQLQNLYFALTNEELKND